MLTLYHGSSEIVSEPALVNRGRAKDFGPGFYCTELYEQARKWALRKTDSGYVNVYSCSIDEDSAGLSVLEFPVMNDAWLDFVHGCRNGGTHSYDVVIGPLGMTKSLTR